jgi:acyl-CoA synthetase (AMP-forming)/AMP-acid ligase II
LESTAWFFERLAQFGDSPALIRGDELISYAKLTERVGYWDTRLQGLGLAAGSPVAFDGPQTSEAVALLLALLRNDFIAVPLNPSMRVHRDEFCELAQAQCLLELTETGEARVTESSREVSHALLKELQNRKHPGLIIFSSGSTGNPKAVVHDAAHLLQKFLPSKQKKSTLAFMQIDHIGGLDTLFGTFGNGGTLVTPTGRDPETICKTLAQHRVHTLPTTPTFLNLMLVSGAWNEHDLSHLKVIAYGSEPMPDTTLARLHVALPHVKLVQTYGLSELGVLRTQSIGHTLWVRFTGEGSQVKVVDGVLWAKAPTAMLGYLNASHLFSEDGWFNTQDAVEVDGDKLRILGRVSDLINVGGQKVYPAEVEAELLKIPEVEDATVYGEKNALTGQVVAAKVTLKTAEPLQSFKQRMRAFLKDRLPSYKIPMRVELAEIGALNPRFKKVRRG